MARRLNAVIPAYRLVLLLGAVLWLLPAYAAPKPNVLLLLPPQGSEAISAAERIFANDFQAPLQRQLLSANELRAQQKQAYEKADLIVSFGANLAAELLASTHHPKLLVLFARRAELDPLVRRYPGRVSGVYLNQPYRRLLAAGRALKPDAVAGSLLGPSTAPWISTTLQQTANAHGAELRLLRMRIGDAPVKVFERLLEEVGLVVAIADPAIFNASNLQSLLLAAYQRDVPVVGYSQAMVDAGAVASVHSDPVLLGRQAASLALRMLSDADLPAAEYPRDYLLAINYQAARTLKLAPLNEALLRAAITEADNRERAARSGP